MMIISTLMPEKLNWSDDVPIPDFDDYFAGQLPSLPLLCLLNFTRTTVSLHTNSRFDLILQGGEQHQRQLNPFQVSHPIWSTSHYSSVL